MTVTTRKATGLPSWPLLLLTGRRGAGKTFTAAEASASPLVGGALWVGYGEPDPDDYAAIPGARFDLVEHDGSIRGLVATLEEIAGMPETSPPTLLVVDSGTRIWETISDDTRARKGDVVDGGELWGPGKADWQAILNAMRRHKGPAIITARYEELGVLADGTYAWKVKAEKGLSYDVDGVIEMDERGTYVLSKIKSPRMAVPNKRAWPGFTVDALWRDMGLADSKVGASRYAAPVAETNRSEDKSGRDWLAELDRAVSLSQVAAIGSAATAAKASDLIRAAIRRKHQQLSPSPAKPGPTPPK